MILLGISSGTLGCFIVLRRLSLVGDSLGHAVLPGVCLGYMVNHTKDPLWLFAGATGAAILASLLIATIQRNTRLKPDVAMGLVLSVFFGAGLVLLSALQNDARGGQGGLNQFFFGQAAAISNRDLQLIGVVTVVIVAGVLTTFKELAVSSFDPGFATALGLPTRAIHYLLMGLTGMAIVISIQAVGVVLLSALLIIPAATALLLTDRLPRMVALSALLASLAGIVGLNASFLSPESLNGLVLPLFEPFLRLGRPVLGVMRDWFPAVFLDGPAIRFHSSPPTGPVIVLALTTAFALALFLSPRYGVLPALVRRWRRRQAVQGRTGESKP